MSNYIRIRLLCHLPGTKNPRNFGHILTFLGLRYPASFTDKGGVVDTLVFAFPARLEGEAETLPLATFLRRPASVVVPRVAGCLRLEMCMGLGIPMGMGVPW